MDHVEEARALTKEALGLQDDDVEYISAELIEELENGTDSGDGDVTVDEEGATVDSGGPGPEGAAETVRVARQDWGNHLVFRPGYVLYRQGAPGGNYACGVRYLKRWNSRAGDQFNPQRRCSSGVYYYQLYRPY